MHPALLLAVLLVSTPALSNTDAPARPHRLAFDWTRDGLIAGGGAVLWVGSELLLKERLAPSTCLACDRAPDGTDALNGVDQWGRGLADPTAPGRQRASTWSDVLVYGALPVGAIGSQWLLGRGSEAPASFFAEDAVIILEALWLSALANQAVKFLVGRERPFVHVLPEADKALTPSPADNNLSFYSGHASSAFALAVAAGTVAELRGYRYREWVWAVGLPLAAATGVLRMMADKHYLSDVLIGALAGCAFGVAVPLLLHGRVASPPGSTGLAVRGSVGLGGATLLVTF